MIVTGAFAVFALGFATARISIISAQSTT